MLSLEEGFLMTEYAHPEVLVTTDWVASHLNVPISGSSKWM